MGNSSSRRSFSRSGSEDSGSSFWPASPRKGKHAGGFGQPAVAILPKKLYVGSRLDGMLAKMSNPKKFTHILCLEESSKYPESDKIKYLHEPLDDDGSDVLLSFVGKVKGFIDDAVKNGGKILIHCTSGVNRAPSIATWYLMETKGLTFDQAKQIVSSKRSGVNIHSSYERQLIQMDPNSKRKSTGLTEEDDPSLAVSSTD